MNAPDTSVFLIAGGAGFIGSHLCERLLQQGRKVICIDNFITGSKSNTKGLSSYKNFECIEHNVIERLPQIAGNVWGIFHLASPASPNKKSPRSYLNHPIETLLVNSLGTYNLLELARQKNARFVYASSSEIYGNPTVSPQREDYTGNVNPVGVRSVYDEGKRFGEALTMAYVRKYNVDARVVRIFNTYGERMQKDDGRAISNFIHQALSEYPLTVYGDGSQTRSFCYVEDLVDGLLSTMEVDEAGGEVINLGNPEEHLILEIARMVKELSDSHSDIVFEEAPPDDPQRRKPDIAKAKNLLGFHPKISLEAGLRRTITYYRERYV